MVVKYDTSVAVSMGRVADVDGSRNITGYFNVGSGLSGALGGEAVTLVGAFGGKHTGHVVQGYACEDKTQYDSQAHEDVWLICLSRADYAADEGDSGGPVLVSGSHEIAGLHSSHAGSTHWFSPINQIDYALNSAYYLNPGPTSTYSGSGSLSASIYGTSTMRPGNTCHWTVSTNVPDPTDFEWIIDGQVVGTSADFYYSTSSSFTLQLEVANGSGQGASGGSLNVHVSPENDDCAEQRPPPGSLMDGLTARGKPANQGEKPTVRASGGRGKLPATKRPPAHGK